MCRSSGNRFSDGTDRSAVSVTGKSGQWECSCKPVCVAVAARHCSVVRCCQFAGLATSQCRLYCGRGVFTTETRDPVSWSAVGTWSCLETWQCGFAARLPWCGSRGTASYDCIVIYFFPAGNLSGISGIGLFVGCLSFLPHSCRRFTLSLSLRPKSHT